MLIFYIYIYGWTKEPDWALLREDQRPDTFLIFLSEHFLFGWVALTSDLFTIAAIGEKAEVANARGNYITVSSALFQVLVVDLGNSRFLRQVRYSSSFGLLFRLVLHFDDEAKQICVCVSCFRWMMRIRFCLINSRPLLNTF